MKKLTREKWIERAASRFKECGGLDDEDAREHAQIYLDDVLGGDVEENPKTAADDAMGDW